MKETFIIRVDPTVQSLDIMKKWSALSQNVSTSEEIEEKSQELEGHRRWERWWKLNKIETI